MGVRPDGLAFIRMSQREPRDEGLRHDVVGLNGQGPRRARLDMTSSWDTGRCRKDGAEVGWMSSHELTKECMSTQESLPQAERLAHYV